jgi:TonB family protein
MKKQIIKVLGAVLLTFFAFTPSIFAQIDTSAGPVFDLFDLKEPPSFPGGEEALFKFYKSVMHYPDQARKAGIQGNVTLTFVIEKDGSLSNRHVLKDIGGGCGEEALRMLDQMPKWNPGAVHGEPVRVRYMLPVRFGYTGPVFEMADVQDLPTFPGGEPALRQSIAAKVSYPFTARMSNIMGIVELSFIVEKDGVISSPVLINDIGGGCGEAALKALEDMPLWNPGMANGKPVRVRYLLPVHFGLGEPFPAEKKN